MHWIVDLQLGVLVHNGLPNYPEFSNNSLIIALLCLIGANIVVLVSITYEFIFL